MLNRESIRALAMPQTREVEIPEWGGAVTIRQFSADQLMRLIALGKTKTEDEQRGMAEAIAASVVDPETGALMYTDADIPEIQSYSVAGLIRLNKAINEFNGLGDAAAKN